MEIKSSQLSGPADGTFLIATRIGKEYAFIFELRVNRCLWWQVHNNKIKVDDDSLDTQSPMTQSYCDFKKIPQWLQAKYFKYMSMSDDLDRELKVGVIYLWK